MLTVTPTHLHSCLSWP